MLMFSTVDSVRAFLTDTATTLGAVTAKPRQGSWVTMDPVTFPPPGGWSVGMIQW